ncbi:MAG TPA: hypothetical protein VFM23_00560 [Gemmatimonadales bacterium]|nr:hypothetical protein [Gemmatimonadales bacterium]
MRILSVAALLSIAACRREPTPAASRQSLATSEAVEVLKIEPNPYYIIYNPPVDLAKKPAP